MEVDAAPTLADAFLSKKQLVSDLIECLAACHSLPTAQPANSVQISTIGDGVFQLLRLLFRLETRRRSL